jgi:outer membrane protein
MIMRKWLACALFIAMVCAFNAVGFSSASASSTDTPYIGVKIGYVDFNRALNEVSDGKNARERLKNEFREKQQRLDLLQTELNSMKEGIDRDGLLLSSDAMKDREKVYRQKLTEVQRRFTEFQQEMSERETQLTDEILKRLKNIVQSIGDKEGYSLILEKSQELVLYAPTAEDLTDRVIRQYNGSEAKKGR